MTSTRPQILSLASAMLLVLAVPAGGAVQPYPNKPVRIVVPFSSGSSADTVARIIANKLTEQLKRPLIVDARPGGTGIIGVEIAKNASPDGYTLLLAGTATFATLPALKPKLPYDPDKDFAVLTRIASVANVVAVHPSLGVSTVPEFVKLAKARPGDLNFGSFGNGSAGHLGGEMFNVLAGIKTVHIPYKGTGLALKDLITGQLQFMVISPALAMPAAKAGRIKVIATAGPSRDPLWPELPTVADVLPGFEVTLWWGVAVPAKTPSAIVKKLHAEIVKAEQTPEVRAQLAKQGATPHAESPAEFTAFIKAERQRLARVGHQAGITFD